MELYYAVSCMGAVLHTLNPFVHRLCFLLLLCCCVVICCVRAGGGLICDMLGVVVMDLRRLFVEQLHYIINHADDYILFFDVSFFKLVPFICAAAPTSLVPSPSHRIITCSSQIFGCVQIDTLRPLIKCKRFVVMTDAAHMPSSCLPLATDFPASALCAAAASAPLQALCYEHIMSAEKPSTALLWPTFDENTASSLCYTSGTTGNPKYVARSL
jgi:acyl-CoA synthetase (AMP-forming)/AMP-acid ligase II